MTKKAITSKNHVSNGVTCGANRKVMYVSEYLQSIMDSMDDLVIDARADGSICYASASAKTMVGVSQEQLCGSNIFELIHERDCAMVKRLLTSLIEQGDCFSCECRMHQSDGNVIWVEVRAHLAQHDHQGDFVAVLRDVSDHYHRMLASEEQRRILEHQLEERNSKLESTIELLKRQANEHERDKLALEQSETRYNALVENTLTGIYIHDGNKVTFCNERFAQIFGFSHEGPEHVNIEGVYAGRRVSEILFSNLQKEEVIEGQTGNGNKVWLKVSRTNLHTNGQNLIIGNVIDITDQIVTNERLKASEKELHLLSAQLIAAQELERKRIANELHDGLGQRLSAVKFAIENVCRLINHENPVQHSQRLDAIVELIRDSIEEVRRVSMDLRPSILDDLGLIATIGWFCREFTQLFPDIGIHRNISANESDIPEEIKVVIFRIVQEAFHNIAKHAQADQIELELYSYNDTLRLMIRDNGRGISCIDSSPCSKGLGLKSMRERAELTKGEIKIDSIQGKGTMVSVQWPCSLN